METAKRQRRYPTLGTGEGNRVVSHCYLPSLGAEEEQHMEPITVDDRVRTGGDELLPQGTSFERRWMPLEMETLDGPS